MVACRPDALALFSMPDAAAASIAIQLATSVLVIAAVTAQRASQALVNLLQLGLPRSRLAGSLAAVTSQRLARQICRICREPAEPPGAQTLALHGIGPEQAQALRFFRGRGRPSCNKVGYRGRREVFEVTTASPEHRATIVADLEAARLEGVAQGRGKR